MPQRVLTCAATCLALFACVSALRGAEGFAAAPASTTKPGEYLTTVGAGVDLKKAAADLAASTGGQVDVVSSGLRILKVTMPANAGAAAMGASLQKASTNVAGIGKLEPNYVRKLHATSFDGPEPDPADYYIWSVTDAYQAWDVRTDARDIIVAVIDDGMGYTHPDLAENVYINRNEIPNNGIDDDRNGFIDDTIGWDIIDNDNDPFPGAPLSANSHGTHVSGTIGAQGDNGVGFSGVCWRARIMPVRVFDQNGFTSSAAIVAAIEYAVRNGAKVINMSLGGYGYNEAESTAIEFARSRGVIVCVSAGNDSNDNDYLFQSYPASYPQDNIIAVAASDPNDNLALFSNYGFANVDLAAPGVSVFSTVFEDNGDPDYDLYDGTSMACPMTAGATTLVWAEHPTESYQQIRARILNAIDPIPSMQGFVVTGGRLNIRKAVGETTLASTIDFRLNGYYANYYSSVALQYAYPAYYYGGLDYNVYLGYLYAYYGYLAGTYVGYRVVYDTDTFDAAYDTYRAVRAAQYQYDGYAAYYLYSADAYLNNGNLDIAAATAYYAYLFAQYDLSY